MTSLARSLFLLGGSLCVVLALVGVFVPVLPTTPFLLLAAFLFTRSSRRALHWLETNRLFGNYFHNYRSGRGMALRQKIITISLLWLSIGLSIIYVIDIPWVQLLLLVIAAGVTTHLVRINTYRPEA